MSKIIKMDFQKLIPKVPGSKIIVDFDELIYKAVNSRLTFRDLIERLLKFLDDFEFKVNIKIKNLPLCFLPMGARDHILTSKKNKARAAVKVSACQFCAFNFRCPGFSRTFLRNFPLPRVEPIRDLPSEIMIEVEPRCNLKCQFCFNKHTFARRGRNIENKLTPDLVKATIDTIKRAGLKVIRFTGGEPLLRKDLISLLRYAKYQNLEVRLNTNGILIDESWAKKFIDVIDNILIPIEDWREREESKICGFPDALKRKVQTIKILKKMKIPTVRVGTVITSRLIYNFEKMAKLICSLPIDDWEFFRPISSAVGEYPISAKDLNQMVDKLMELKKRTGRHYFIANAVPFCAIDDLNKINSMSTGALSDDGHNRLVVDPRGFVKPHYFIDKNIGNPLNILKCWNHPFMKKMRNLGFVPEECKNCSFLEKCRGGSRFLAKLYFDRWDAKDPLMP